APISGQSIPPRTLVNGPTSEKAGIFFHVPAMLSCMFPWDLEHHLILNVLLWGWQHLDPFQAHPCLFFSPPQKTASAHSSSVLHSSLLHSTRCFLAVCASRIHVLIFVLETECVHV
uniref:Uncharacterized protein n=1 Tax=Crocodylus porosus TaxID=8502 RepID=A0A7M4EQ73_CROPO